jgi:gliding motility-associated-like protein
MEKELNFFTSSLNCSIIKIYKHILTMKKLKYTLVFAVFFSFLYSANAQITGIKIVGDTCKDLSLGLQVEGKSSSPYFFWSFGDPNSGTKDTITINGSSATPFPTHTFTKLGQYKVCASFQEPTFPVTSVCRVINVGLCSNCIPKPPSIFTPDGAEPNNTFHPYYIEPATQNCQVTSYECQVFNSWGQSVFKTNSITEKWNGKLNDTPCPAGVYTYYIIYKLPNQDAQKIQGDVTLIR